MTIDVISLILGMVAWELVSKYIGRYIVPIILTVKRKVQENSFKKGKDKNVNFTT